MASRFSLWAVLLVGVTNLPCAEADEAQKLEQEWSRIPLLVGESSPLLTLRFSLDQPRNLAEVMGDFSGTTDMTDIESIVLAEGERELFVDDLRGSRQLDAGDHELTLYAKVREEADLTHRIAAKVTGLRLADGEVIELSGSEKTESLRLAYPIHRQGEAECHTTRIPALTRTANGTLLGVYDLRYNGRKDLQEHMDIGLSRSTDGGQTWESPRPIMDMGEYGGKGQNENGVSDPNILVDTTTGEIFVSAVWTYGKPGTHQWVGKGSESGFDIEKSSQFMVVRSTDDGLSWSEPENWTRQLKREEWWLFAPAPGNGITLDDGTLVMPTQGRDEVGFPFSNLMWSKDHGETWTVSAPARDDTSECAVAQLSDGSLMLNIRDNRNRKDKGDSNGRAVGVTRDLGRTWTVHSSDHGALPEPTCMASLISHTLADGRRVLLFSNPHDKSSRKGMTIQLSLDDGVSWPEKHHVLLDVAGGAYSSLVMVDDKTVGILYESSRANLVFQKIPLRDLLND